MYKWREHVLIHCFSLLYHYNMLPYLNTKMYFFYRTSRIIQNGQLEILGGGWVMPDEASTHYAALLDEMTEGHLWIADSLGRI